MRVAYFVHDLADPAVAKRVRMLRAGGAEPLVVGFRRVDQPVTTVADAEVLDLGRTYDANFPQRILAVFRQAMRSGRHAKAIGAVDVCLARNLEMLALAQAFRRFGGLRAPVAYECLDVHRLLLRTDLVGRALRAIEGALMRSCGLLIVSSPAFLRAYFQRHHAAELDGRLPVLLVENKVFAPNFAPAAARAPRPPPGPPWRIGWYGAIRCRRSLEILRGLAERRPDLVRVVIRGRPTPAVFPDLAAELAGLSNITFAGPYTADDLADLYADVHFTWAIDYFEAGANSTWLLPNRIYEGGLYGVPALAQRDVETGAWLAGHALGVLMDHPESELERVLETMDENRYAALAERGRAAPRGLFLADASDCADLARALGEAA